MLLLSGILLFAVVVFLLRFNLWRRPIRGVPILMYHLVTEELSGTGLPKLRVSEKRFRAQMAYLRKLGYESITLREWFRYRRGVGTPPAKPIIITFDDGYRDVFTTAWPILEANGLRAVVFLVTKFVGRSNLWDREKAEPQEPLLCLEEIQALARCGNEIGSHGHSHRDLTRLGWDDLMGDLSASKTLLEGALGESVTSFAYPYGRHDSRVRAAVREAGFEAACGIHPGGNDEGADPLALKRIMVKRKDTLLDFRVKLRCGKSRI